MAKLGINTGLLPNDGTGDSLLVGASKINNNFNEIYSRFGNGTNLTAIGGTWISNSVGIHTIKNVGIGTTNPVSKLTVGGNAIITGILTVGSSSVTIDGTNNIIKVGTGITIDGSTGIITAKSIYINGNAITGSAVTYITAGAGISVDQNFGNVRISSSTWNSTQAGVNTTSNVGIGTTNPKTKLTVSGVTSTTNLFVNENAFIAGIALTIGTGSGSISFRDLITYSSIALDNDSVNIQAISGDINFNTSGNVNIGNAKPHYFSNNGNAGIGTNLNHYLVTQNIFNNGITTTSTIHVGESGTVFYTNSSGLIGIGTINPSTKLEVNSVGYSTISLKSGSVLGSLYASSTDNFVGLKNNSDSSGLGVLLSATRSSGADLVIFRNTRNVVIGDSPTEASQSQTANQKLQVQSGVFISGSVGIGTTNPTSKLTVSGGDISVGVNTSNGIVLTSANGTKYRLIVSNTGVLSTVAI